jgi:membrane-associated phospholipid phosphatase
VVATGVAAPALRRRLSLPKRPVIAAAALAPLGAAVVVPRGRLRDASVVALQMWAYLAAYEMPNDDPQALAQRVRVHYPIAIDRALGLGQIPTARLQHTFARPGRIRRFERVLVFSHWIWFTVPHGTVGYILLRRPERFAAAAVRTYAVFDLGAIFYWVIPTAPPWWAAERGHLGELEGTPPVRRMMIEYGQEFWGDRWGDLYDVLGGNPLAAMPSLHFATSLMAAHLLSEVGPVSGLAGWSYALTLGLALVYLGEHYAADLLAGAVLAETVRAGAPRLTPAARRLARLLERTARLAANG